MARWGWRFIRASISSWPNEGSPYVLEINTIPGMTEASLLPEAAAVAGIGYGGLCERIIELSLARIERRKLQRA